MASHRLADALREFPSDDNLPTNGFSVKALIGLLFVEIIGNASDLPMKLLIPLVHSINV